MKKSEVKEIVETARHKELVGYIRAAFAIVVAAAGGYLYSVEKVVLNLYSYEVTRPYETLGIALLIIGFVWAFYEGITIYTQRKIQAIYEISLQG